MGKVTLTLVCPECEADVTLPPRDGCLATEGEKVVCGSCGSRLSVYIDDYGDEDENVAWLRLVK